jgi:zinc transporter, ZIP family
MVWLEAFAWGWVASAGLLLGAAFGAYGPLEHRGIARAMSFGSGVLFATISLDLVTTALRASSLLSAGMALGVGALAFSSVNAMLSRRGAKDRKRCGGCVEQATERGVPGSGLAIAVGTLMDSVPEGLVLGVESAHAGSPGHAIVVAFIVGNFPEALSSAAGMTVAKRSNVFIWTVWLSAAALTAVSAALGAALLPSASESAIALIKAGAAGALLAMTVETLVPEAADAAVGFSGVVTAAGFMLLAALLMH